MPVLTKLDAASAERAANHEQTVEQRLQRLYDALAGDDLSALWLNLANLAPHRPPAYASFRLWPAATLQARIEQASEAISAEDAERRVIVFENPAMPGRSAVTPSLYAGIQLLLPGESARSHRHTAAALRLVRSGTGGYTAVDGERVTMSPGDFIVTPSWTYHDHGNEGDTPVTWLDGLDVHIVNLFGAPFGNLYPGLHQDLARPEGDAMLRYGRGVEPVTGTATTNRSIFHWPYTDTRASLMHMRATDPVDSALGYKIRYVDPRTGRGPMATMDAFMQMLPAGFDGQFHRVTDGTVFSVVEGTGAVEIGDRRWEFGPHDVFVVPTWSWHRFVSREGAVLFSFSDRALQRYLGMWREERAGHSLPALDAPPGV